MACADSPERVKECTIASNGHQKPLAPLKSEIRRTAVELSIDRRKGVDSVQLIKAKDEALREEVGELRKVWPSSEMAVIESILFHRYFFTACKRDHVENQSISTYLGLEKRLATPLLRKRLAVNLTIPAAVDAPDDLRELSLVCLSVQPARRPETRRRHRCMLRLLEQLRLINQPRRTLHKAVIFCHSKICRELTNEFFKVVLDYAVQVHQVAVEIIQNLDFGGLLALESCLRSALNDATEEELIELNPLGGWTYSRKAAPPKEDDIDPFSPE
ncbi:unnamed protein product, partial [Mesorhabditis spiculigera]